MRSPGSARRSLPRWSPPSLIRRLFDQDGTSQPGLASYPSCARAEERISSVRSANRANRYLRSLFVAGALAVIRYAKIHGTRHRPWLTALLARRPTKVAAIRARQQARQDGVGHDGEGRTLQGTCRARGVTGSRWVSWVSGVM